MCYNRIHAALLAGILSTVLFGGSAIAGELTNREPALGARTNFQGGPMGGLGIRSHRTGPARLDQAEVIKQSLGLTDAQVTKLAPAFEKNNQNMDSLRRNSSLSRADRSAKLKEIHQSFDKALAETLTPEQAQQWRKLRAHPSALSPQHMPARFGATESPTPPPAFGLKTNQFLQARADSAPRETNATPNQIANSIRVNGAK